MSDKQLYRLHRNMYTGDLFGNWIGTNNDGMSSESGMFEFVFVPVEPETLFVKCRFCEGSGTVPEDHGQGMTEWLGCPDCQAAGFVDAALGLDGAV